jgi:hypothetical protein
MSLLWINDKQGILCAGCGRLKAVEFQLQMLSSPAAGSVRGDPRDWMENLGCSGGSVGADPK